MFTYESNLIWLCYPGWIWFHIAIAPLKLCFVIHSYSSVQARAGCTLALGNFAVRWQFSSYLLIIFLRAKIAFLFTENTICLVFYYTVWYNNIGSHFEREYGKEYRLCVFISSPCVRLRWGFDYGAILSNSRLSL